MAFSKPFIDKIKSIHVAKTIKTFVPLLPYTTGDSFIGICPFHNEKTPSFHVSHDRYKCYGCGSSGSAIDFVMKFKKISYSEAILCITSNQNIPLSKNRKSRKSKKQRNIEKHFITKSKRNYWSDRIENIHLSKKSQERYWRTFYNFRKRTKGIKHFAF